LRQHFYNVYAFCRWADDLGDEIGDPSRSLELLAWWRRELEACYADAPRHPVFVALRPTIRRFDIPREPFADLISAFEQDQRVREYDTFAQLQDYCRRSADPVGRIVLHLCERRCARTEAWSDSICTGLQLANFWQDVARDRQIGRVYLPREDRLRFCYTDADLNSATTNGAFLGLMQFEVERARAFLEAGRPLVEAMPGRLQVDIDLFIRGGLQILREIERIGYRVWERRPVVSKGQFAWMVMTGAGRVLWRRLRRRAH
jgi:squalene synthase HpnC